LHRILYRDYKFTMCRKSPHYRR